MIKYKLGFSFAPPIVIVGVIVSIAGVLTAIEGPLLGILLIIAGGFIWSSTYGSQIDPTNIRFREYGSVFGIKSGKWRPLDEAPFITVMKGREGMTVYSRSNLSTTSIDDRFEVCLLSNTHRSKTVIMKFENEDQAAEYAKAIALKLDKEIVQYSPKISEKTRSRSKRR